MPQFNLKIFLIIGITMVFVALVVHELGHLLTVVVLGEKLASVRILGLQLYPEFQIIGFKGGYLGYVGWIMPYSSAKSGLILLMGSGVTLIIAGVSLILLHLIRPINFIIKTLLLFASLWYLDIVTYSFGLRFSGDKEPLEAAMQLGLSEVFWFFVVAFIFTVFSGSVLYYIIKSRYFLRSL